MTIAHQHIDLVRQLGSSDEAVSRAARAKLERILTPDIERLADQHVSAYIKANPMWPCRLGPI